MSRAVEMSDASPASLHYLAKALKVATCPEGSTCRDKAHDTKYDERCMAGKTLIDGAAHMHMNEPHDSRVRCFDAQYHGLHGAKPINELRTRAATRGTLCSRIPRSAERTHTIYGTSTGLRLIESDTSVPLARTHLHYLHPRVRR